MTIFDHYVASIRSTFYIIQPKLMIIIINFINFKNLLFDIIRILGYEKRRLCLISLIDQDWMSIVDHFLVVI